MSLPPSDFAAAFRAHVVPKLREVIAVRGHFVGIGLYDFGAAHADVMAVACRLGANHLPEPHLLNLEDWCLTTLANVAAETEAKCG